ncbi:endonuclease domain-containing protein [Tsukamurella hominis]|uniref:endonuclease domain-containing protein n=1 Tax=Tsukamurella hominis TaxID=1970232 RepID=UPI0039ED697C
MGRRRELLGGRTEHALRQESTPVIHGIRHDGAATPSNDDVLEALESAYPDLVFVCWSAAALHGVEYAAGHRPEIWLPAQGRRHGVVMRCGHLPVEDVVTVSGHVATSIVRTAVDVARFAEGDEKIAGVDQFIRVDRLGRSLTTKAAILAYLDTHPGLYGANRVRDVIAEASNRAQSPWETYSRLVVHRSGLDFFRPQQPVPGTPFHVDLGSGKYRIAIEYDGDYHRSTEQQRIDIARWNAITDQKWIIIRVTSPMLLSGRAAFLDRVARELRARGWSGPSPTNPPLKLPKIHRLNDVPESKTAGHSLQNVVQSD